MGTYGSKMLSDFDGARATLLKLSQSNYDPADMRDVLSNLGAKTEIFLKSVALPGKNLRETFFWFIDQLAGVSIHQSFRDKLHALRKKYNDAKHDPTIVIPLLEAVQVVDDAREAINEIVARGVGLVNAVFSPHSDRVFWLAAWDHYIGGDSEIHVILPAESEHWLGPPTFDTIYVGIPALTTITATLDTLGILKPGDGLIPKTQMDSFRGDSDFAGAWVFEGDYRSLITTLAQHELRQQLVPGLNRHDDLQSMLIAFLMAGVDVAVGMSDPKDFRDAVLQQAIDVYAVPPTYAHAAEVADQLTDMFQKVPHTDWPKVSGPIWVGDSRFAEAAATSLAKHSKYDIIVDDECVVRMRWSHR